MQIDSIKKVLNQYIYAIRDKKIYSKTYFNEVLCKIYNDKAFKKQFALFFADADKLGKLNNEQGYEVGNVALKNSLDIIVKKMPKNMQLTRIGGDEFIGIIDNSNKDELLKKIEEIQNVLKQDDDKIKVRMTFGVSDSQEYQSFSNMLLHAENLVMEQKHKKRNVSKLEISDIKNNIYENVLEFYECLRLGQRNLMDYEKMDFCKEYITAKCDQLFTQEEEHLESENKQINNTFENNYHEELSLKEALIIQKYVKSKNIIDNVVNYDKDLAKSIFKKVFQKMLYNPYTKQFNSLYYDTILEKKLNTQMKTQHYNLVYLHATGLKVSNTLNGYENTDYYLYNMQSHIENLFNDFRNSNFTFFTKRPFDFTERSAYMFDMNAGNIMLIIPEKKLSSEKVEEKLQTFYNQYESSYLHVNYSMQNTANFKDMHQCLSQAKFDSKLKKVNIFNKLDKVIVQQLIDKYLLSAIEFYKGDEDKYSSLETQAVFKETFIKTFEEIYVQKYVEQQKGDLEER